MHIIPIASGKGGVGKTLISANLSIALAKAGKKVLLADLDLGASNLHLMLGCRSPKTGIGTFLTSENASFEDIIIDTDYEGLRFIPGDAEIPGLANIKPGQRNRLIKQLLLQDADYLVLDLGAGTNSIILDFFLMSNHGLIVTTPTLTATLNAYLFLKNVVFRLMYTTFGTKSKAHDYLESLRKDGASLQRAYIPTILQTVQSMDPESYQKFWKRAQSFHPRLVMNMLEDPKDAEKSQKIRRSCTEYLNIDIEHLGIVYRDEIQDVALASRLPIIIYKPQSVLAQAVFRIADKLIQLEGADEMPQDSEYFDESYQAAETEAEIDFDAKMESMEELLHSGALSVGDMIDTVKGQQYEINQLRKENQFLKHKLAEAIRRGFTS
jgi:flagellar biosynthesis protein FlhG